MLNLQQKMWLKRATPAEIVEKIQAGVLTLEALEEFARTDAAFAPRMPLVRDVLRFTPDPREAQDFGRVLELYNSAPGADTTLLELNRYMQQWSNAEFAADHLAQVRQFATLLGEAKDFASLKPLAEQAMADMQTPGAMPRRDVTAMVTGYINTWQSVPGIDASHMALAKEWEKNFAEFYDRLAADAWQSILTPEGSLISYEALLGFMNAYPGNSYGLQADDLLWNWALAQDDVFAAVEKYSSYTRGCGRHAADVDNLATAAAQWQAVEQSRTPGDVSDYAIRVIDFINNNPGHPFVSRAKEVLVALKPEVLAEIRRNPIAFFHGHFMKLYNSGVFDTDELCEAANANDYLLDRIRNYYDIDYRLKELNLGDIMADMLHGYGQQGIADVLFFGISSSGKTCILSGLLNNPELSFDTVNFSCKYAEALQTYALEGFAPPATTRDAVAVIKADTTRGNKKFHFNLVDMAGETFRHRIADNENAIVDFKDMGEGAPEILNNGNDKVVFIVVDPHPAGSDATTQRNALRRLIDLFFKVEDNRRIMQHVKGIHFIVSKADTVEEPRLQNSRDIVRNLLGDQDCRNFVDECRKLGINASKQANLDGVPRVFCFSLGRFSVSNVYDYNRADSDIIIQTICDYVSGMRPTGMFHKIRSLLTESLV